MPTTYNRPKSFTWSFSHLKNFSVCPKKYYHVQVAKDYKEEEGESLTYGKTIHKVLELYIEHGTILPPVHEPVLKPIADRYIGNRAGAEILVEQKYGLTRDFAPCDFFAKDVWFRGVADFVKIKGPVALMVDWKTGRVKENQVQLALMAASLFAHRPDVKAIRTEFVWIDHDAVTREDFKREEIAKVWANVLPEVETLERAYKLTEFPARPGGLCRKYCPVSSCPYHGKGG